MSKKKRNKGIRLTGLGFITFVVFYFWFNSLFEIIAQDINTFKIWTLIISSVALMFLIWFGVIELKDIFDTKRAKY